MLRTRRIATALALAAATAAAGTALLASAVAQESVAGEGAGEGTGEGAKRGEKPLPEGSPSPDCGGLVKDLGADDFQVRERAYAALRAAGEGARGALEEGARSEDSQIRWSTGRLLRLLETPPGGAGRDGAEPERRRDGLPPFLPGDPRREDAGERRLRSDIDRTLDGIRRRMEEIERRFARGGGLFPDSFPAPEDGQGREGPAVERHVVVDRGGERIEVDRDAGGRVRVVLTRRAGDGTETKEEFEAPGLEALEEKHPGVYAKVKDLLGNTLRIRIGRSEPFPGGSLFDRFPRSREGARGESGGALPDLFAGERPLPGAGAEAGGPRLGVTVTDVPAALRTQLSVPEGEGLVVEEVLEGTLARRLGLERHDILLSINGIPVSTPADVRNAVGAVEEGGEVRVRILRAGRRDERSANR